MRVSVAVPAYNEEKLIARTLKSLKRQTVPCEVVVCDNASTDGTGRIARRYADRVVREERRGVAHAFNAAARASSGELLAFTGADCIVPPDWIESYLPLFRDSRVISCFGPVHAEGRSYRRALKCYSIFYGIITRLKITWGISDANMMVRRSVMERVGYFDPRVQMMEDSHLVRRIRRYGRFRFVRDNVVRTSARRFEKEGAGSIFLSYLRSLIIMKLRGRVSRRWLSTVR